SACSMVPTRDTLTSGSPFSTQPKRTVSSPKLIVIPCARARADRKALLLGRAARLGARLQSRENLRGNVDRLIAVEHALAQHQVEVLRLGVSLHFLEQRSLELTEL